MTSAPEDEIKITLPESLRPLIRLMLTLGIRFEASAGISVKHFLEKNLPAGKDYIDKNIQTVFMDGQAIDEPERTYIKEPCTIALSAAMPGVFGAAFRKKGAYSGLRGDYKDIPEKQKADEQSKTVMVTLKCFNQVAQDLGGDLLAGGIRMDIRDFTRFWGQQQRMLEKECLRIIIGGNEVESRQVPELLDGKTGELNIEFIIDENP
ncbi:MAG: hypothetical protein K9J79_09810 [Desulfobacteraceae bacterium]|nr:hypothetical protein [Desulfobacteraceae bacterium]MCF8095640.1 hypothetical protein [Desulfobacteraceae bacterium]